MLCILFFAHRGALDTPSALGPRGLGGQQPSLRLPQGHGTAGSRDRQVECGWSREGLVGLVTLGGPPLWRKECSVERHSVEPAAFLRKVLPLYF